MIAAGPASRWITVPRPQPRAEIRLLCLPHAGGGASTFFPWAAALEPAGIEVRSVQFPGRENRLAEAAIADVPTMVKALATQWPVISDGGSCALYGHSMGAVLAYELTLELQRRGATNLPMRLFIGGRNPPHAPAKRPSIHALPDREFIAAVARHYGNLPSELLADAEMMALITPILRADLTLVDTYLPASSDRIDVPLTILGGTDDPWTTPAELEQWRQCTTSSSRIATVVGGHFFHQKHRNEVLAEIRADLVRK